jgi:thymidylate synthase (FAD)
VIELLDHGYLKLVETWGSDEQIIRAARMSTDKGFLGWGPFCSKCGIGMLGSGLGPTQYERGEQKGCDHDAAKPGDEKLLRYLYTNAHNTPFEMAGLTIEVQAPIMVFREWHRHRVPFGYNEMSARYTPLPDLNYVPTVERLLLSSKSNKQAGKIKGADELTEQHALEYQECLRQQYRQDQEMYEYALRAGVPKELARIHLPVGRYSRMMATGNLRGWLAFLTLRQAPNAQWEIRMYANAVGTLIERAFPRTWGLFAEKQT